MTVHTQDSDFTLHQGDCIDVLRSMPEASVHCCVTSPPYWGLRDYGSEGQIGLEATPDEFVARMVDVFREVRRVLRDDGTLWLNLGDSYVSTPSGSLEGSTLGSSTGQTRHSRQAQVRDGKAVHGDVLRPFAVNGLAPKNLVGIPWRVAFALQADGWWLRSDIIWEKPNPMPESVTDRPTKAHEYVFLLTKSASYFFDQEAVREPHSPDGRKQTKHIHSTDDSHPNYDNVGNGNERWPNGGRNVRSVWEIATQPYAEAHFATFPQELPRRCIAAGSPAGGTVLDPFMGSGTTALVARNLGRQSVGIELNPDYCDLAAKRLGQQSLLAAEYAS